MTEYLMNILIFSLDQNSPQFFTNQIGPADLIVLKFFSGCNCNSFWFGWLLTAYAQRAIQLSMLQNLLLLCKNVAIIRSFISVSSRDDDIMMLWWLYSFTGAIVCRCRNGNFEFWKQIVRYTDNMRVDPHDYRL
jgi:hypothetical protein